MEPQLIIVLSILAVTVFLIVTELIRIDLVALLAMLSLTWTGIISAEDARSGFSSNAVMAIMGVMVLGRGLFKSGVTEKLASFILSIAGSSKRRILATVSATVGVMSGFMQNIGAAALFLPVMMGISKREKIPVSSLLMPMGFTALLGGTLTMVGTSSLIVLNDLMATNDGDAFGLFTVTPIGIALLVVGIAFFAVFGDYIFPTVTEKSKDASAGQKLLNVWGLSDTIYTLHIPSDSGLIGRTVEDSEMGSDYNLNLMRVYDDEQSDYQIWKDIEFQGDQNIVVQGRSDEVERFVEDYGLVLAEEEDRQPQDSKRGYLEVVIPARSNLVGHSIRELSLRETYNAQVVLFFSGSEIIEEDVADREIQAGDTLVLYGKWENLEYFVESEDYITVSPFKYEPKSPDKAWFAVATFAGAIGVVFLTGLPISMGFLTGAVAMILGGVLSIEEAYRAIEWKVIFLISGLIPIGIAMEQSGTARFIANNLVNVVGGLPPFVILLVLGALTTVFSLFMSNVAATVLLVPLVLQISADIPGLTPEAMVLQVGVCAANSFVIPTHHVNALLMTPGGYKVSDYLRAGSILSVIFLLVCSSMIYFLFT
jgi:di/tricarboxylate transporter